MSCRYPKVLDTMVSELMRETDLQEALQHMLSAGLHTRRHCLLADTGTSVWLALNHPNDDVRLLAVRELVKSISNVEVRYEEMYSGILPAWNKRAVLAFFY